jgi:hypothetical protein
MRVEAGDALLGIEVHDFDNVRHWLRFAHFPLIGDTPADHNPARLRACGLAPKPE